MKSAPRLSVVLPVRDGAKYISTPTGEPLAELLMLVSGIALVVIGGLLARPAARD